MKTVLAGVFLVMIMLLTGCVYYGGGYGYPAGPYYVGPGSYGGYGYGPYPYGYGYYRPYPYRPYGYYYRPYPYQGPQQEYYGR